MILVECLETFVNTLNLESFQASDRKDVDDWARDCNYRLLKVICGERLVWFAIIILAIDSLHLTSNTVLVEQGLLEELRKYIDCFRELLRGYIKVEISLVVTCVCIGFSSIITHILQVVILLWIFFGSLEEHVFTKMSHTVKLLAFVIWVLWIA